MCIVVVVVVVVLSRAVGSLLIICTRQNINIYCRAALVSSRIVHIAAHTTEARGVNARDEVLCLYVVKSFRCAI